MLSVEHDRIGKDYSLSLKTFNPQPADLTGTYLASYLQSLTPHLALGVEAVYQRPTPEIEDCSLGYMAKYHNVRKDEQGQPMKDSWIATAQILSQGMWQATYWKKLAERVDAGVDLVIQPALDPRQRKAVATAGVKYDFRMATFRGQVDSDGKVSALLEQRLSPAFAFLVAGEMGQCSCHCAHVNCVKLTKVAFLPVCRSQAEQVQVWCRNHGRECIGGSDGIGTKCSGARRRAANVKLRRDQLLSSGQHRVGTRMGLRIQSRESRERWPYARACRLDGQPVMVLRSL